MNTVYHTSPSKIEKIERYGSFDDCLFFACTPYAVGNVVATYSMEVETIEVSEFFYEEDCEKINSVVVQIAETLEVAEEEARELLDGSKIAEDGEDDWFIQAKQGEAAKLLGYDGAKSVDEQGSVYIIPMLGRESDLIEIL